MNPHSSLKRDDEASRGKPLKQVLADASRRCAKPLVSAVLADGGLAEMVYDAANMKTTFAVSVDDDVRYVPEIQVKGITHTPYSPDNNLVQNGIVLFPSKADEYGTQADLVAEIAAFIHRYVDMDSFFEEVTTYYVLLSWVYDVFNELPYLRIRGDYGSGKTRFLLTVGSLCYLPIFASGASTVSPLFRLLDTFRGTLIVDEGDFRFSDERAEFVKILNNGNARGFPVLRSEATPSKEFNPRAYVVYGPKLVGMRGLFDDAALESRFLTQTLDARTLRADVPINLPDQHAAEAQALRNKLLMFRFRTRQQSGIVNTLMERTIEPRLNQIFIPLLSVIKDETARQRLKELAKNYQKEVVADRGQALEGQILTIIRDLLVAGETRVTVKAITERFIASHGDDYDRKISSRWIGSVVRKRLNMKTQKSNGVYVLALSGADALRSLYARYGLAD